MKPFESAGLTLESTAEAYAARDALTHACGVLDPEDCMIDVIEHVATAIGDEVEAHELAGGNESDKPFSLTFPEQIGATLVLTAVRAAAEFHTNELVQQTAADMVYAYEQHILDSVIGTPAQEQPPEAR